MIKNNLDVVLNVKPHKVSKYLRVMFQDISEDMQNKVAPASSAVYQMLRIGDAKNALTQVDIYMEAMKEHTQEMEHLREIMVRDILNHLDIVEGEATQYVAVDGRQKWSTKKGDKVIMGKPKAKEEILESAPDTEVLEDSLNLQEDSLGVDSGSE
tara:strand:- start:340 stop:804 length:465 start_codon:yes stop_codon:yes gene_type:complete